MKRIGILQCDRVRPELIERHGDYPDMFRGLLEPQLRRPSGSTVSLPVFDVEHGRYPDDPADCYAYLITGSRAGVYDPEPWIRPLMGFARELHRRRIPVAGICFGHQLLAQALGGRAEKSAKGWGVGIRRVAVAAQRPWMQPPLAAFELIYSHQDQVTRLPPGARRLAGDTFCPNAMFELDRLVLGCQGHPEFSPEYAAALLDLRAARIGADATRAARASLTGARDHEVVARWLLSFLDMASSEAPGE